MIFCHYKEGCYPEPFVFSSDNAQYYYPGVYPGAGAGDGTSSLGSGGGKLIYML